MKGYEEIDTLPPSTLDIDGGMREVMKALAEVEGGRDAAEVWPLIAEVLRSLEVCMFRAAVDIANRDIETRAAMLRTDLNRLLLHQLTSFPFFSAMMNGIVRGDGLTAAAVAIPEQARNDLGRMAQMTILYNRNHVLQVRIADLEAELSALKADVAGEPPEVDF